MKVILFFFLVLAANNLYCQDSKVKIDSGNKNKIEVVQEGIDSSQKSDITLGKTDSNTIKINQKHQAQEAKIESKHNSFMDWLTNFNTILGLLISLGVVIITWAGIFRYKKKKKAIK